MAFNPDNYITVGTGPIMAALTDALRAAYNDGAKDTIARFVAAAQPDSLALTPVAVERSSQSTMTTAYKVGRGNRAPRGTVPRIIDDMLSKAPGRTIQDYEAMLPEYDSRVSPRSIGNELRRFEGRKYRRDRFNWWPISQTNEAPDTPRQDPSDAPSVSPNQGGSHGTALT